MVQCFFSHRKNKMQSKFAAQANKIMIILLAQNLNCLICKTFSVQLGDVAKIQQFIPELFVVATGAEPKPVYLPPWLGGRLL